MPVDWKARVFTTKQMKNIEVLAAKRFGDGVIAEEASTFVIEQLSANDWQRLSEFKGNAKPDTFLFRVINNLLEEFARRRFGRVRAPTWLKQEGDLWIRIWTMACLERQPARWNRRPPLHPRTARSRFRNGHYEDHQRPLTVVR